MALAKFSKFKKERALVKEARSKEKKIKSFNKVFNEKLAEIGVNSISELSEEQIQKVLASLGTVNEDRMREIEKDVIAAGKPKDSGSEGEVAKKHTFTSPQVPKGEDEAAADDLKADVEVEGSDDDVTIKEAKKVSEEEDDEEKAAHYKDAAKDDYAQIAKLKKDAHDDKESEDHYEDEEDKNESVDEAKIDEKDIKSDADFDKYADEVLKKAHPDDFDEATAKKVKDGLKKKYKDDYGAMVGALTSGFGK